LNNKLQFNKKHPITMSKQIVILSFIAAIIILASIALLWRLIPNQGDGKFDRERAYQLVKYQVDLGPRIPGSQSHQQIVAWISDEVKKYGWSVEIQVSEEMGHPVQNIVARRGEGDRWVILGAHYDSRLYADHDPDPAKQTQPVPGANDGASGVAVLLELARTLPTDSRQQVWLVFFDAEDNGHIPGWDWILGSRAFVRQLTGKPDAVVIVDMIGGIDQKIYMEGNSNPLLSAEIWAVAARRGFVDRFIPIPKHNILDDQTPFLEVGIPAVDIIDIDYAYYHTTADTADKVSAESLYAVGDTLLAWLTSGQ
jgi:Zn-dependent M28 family amino/carboxypeptidase